MKIQCKKSYTKNWNCSLQSYGVCRAAPGYAGSANYHLQRSLLSNNWKPKLSGIKVKTNKENGLVVLDIYKTNKLTKKEQKVIGWSKLNGISLTLLLLGPPPCFSSTAGFLWTTQIWWSYQNKTMVQFKQQYISRSKNK